MNEQIAVTKINMKMLKFCTEKHIPYMPVNINIEYEDFVDGIVKGMILKLNKKILATEVNGFEKTIIFPKDWKEAVKKQFFPKWLLRKYPVKYHREVIRWIQYATFLRCRKNWRKIMSKM